MSRVSGDHDDSRRSVPETVIARCGFPTVVVRNLLSSGLFLFVPRVEVDGGLLPHTHLLFRSVAGLAGTPSLLAHLLGQVIGKAHDLRVVQDTDLDSLAVNLWRFVGLILCRRILRGRNRFAWLVCRRRQDLAVTISSSTILCRITAVGRVSSTVCFASI